MQEVLILNRCALILAVAIALVAGVCFAESIAAPEVKAGTSSAPVVTVIAPPNPKIIEKQAQEFVQSYAAAPNPNLDQIGRWHDPVCVMVMGLPQAEQAAKIKARIETMAHASGLPAAYSNCKPNVEIAFEDDPQSAMNGVSNSDHVQYLLGYYHLSDQLRTVRHPIQSWYVTETRGNLVNIGALVESKIPPDFCLRPTIVDDPNAIGAAGCYERATG